MTTVWWAILAAAAVSFSYKALGPALLGDRRLPEQAESVIALLAPSLLAGLVVVALTGPGWTDLDGTLLAGVAVAAGVRLCRAPVPAAVLAGVLATALLRLLLGG
ncbi:AzlD domain-containing protein [Streptomyces sp. NPDC058423]|uniref:AzlD domain-containing protein n=1 Tax=unclassified Streptomyces TaxID=2593676 RepID=UPI003658BCA7